MQPRRFLGHLEEADAFDGARRIGEVLVDEFALQSTASKICAPQ
jgi:hypothetical protein